MLLPEEEFLKLYNEAKLDLKYIENVIDALTDENDKFTEMYQKGYRLVFALKKDVPNLFYAYANDTQIHQMAGTYNVDGMKLLRLISH